MLNVSLNRSGTPFTSVVELISPVENGRHFVNDTLKCIFVNEKFCMWIKLSLNIVPKDQVGNNPALVQMMVLRQLGDKPLSDPMLTRFTDAYFAE